MNVERTNNTVLSDREFEAFVLRREHDMSMNEIADEMGVERGTVRRMRQRIKVKLNKAHRTVELDAEYRRQDN